MEHRSGKRPPSGDLADSFEKRWRVLFDSDSTWINICDSRCTILEVNQAGVDIMEADSPAQLIGMRLPEMAWGDRGNAIHSCEAQLLQARESRSMIELRTFRGNRRWLEVVLVRFPDDPPGEERFFSMLTDRTQEKLAQEELAQRKQELAQIMRVNTLGEMATGLAHELNQPLAAIQSYIEGCQRRIANASCDKSDFLYVLERMAAQITRAVGTLNEVRFFFRKDDSRIGCEDINAIVASAVSLWKTLTSTQDIQFRIETAAGLPPVMANAVQIEQVLLNLIRNAEESLLERGDEGIIPVISITTEKAGENMVKISVSDNGSGLPQGGGIDIWSQFVTTKENGMGMGLPICRSIIEAHRGQITASNNEQGGGATFSFTLPVHRPEVEECD